MRYSQDRKDILQDIHDLRQELQSDINTIRMNSDLPQTAVERWDRLLNRYSDYYSNYSDRELQSIRREMLNIRALKTSSPEGAEEFNSNMASVLDEFRLHSKVWNKAVERVFKRFVEQIPFMADARYKYEVLQAITEAKNIRRVDTAVENIRTAYDEALAKVGNDDENELMAEFIRIFHDKQGIRREVIAKQK